MPARILIIEDNQTNLDLMVYLFQAFGYVPLTARDGREGLATLAGEAPDLIICDLEMPGMNGYQFARELKARFEQQRIPLVAVTAYAMVGDRDRVLTAGFDGYLPKPINPETFVSQAEAFLRPEQRARRPEPLPPTRTAASPPPPKRATILLVDDSPVNLSLICSTLEPSGYEVIAARTADEAADIAQRTSFDLILSDLHMPERNGLDFLRRVKADPRLRSIPFVLFSASSPAPGEGLREQASALGAETFLGRPVEPQALLFLVESCLQRGRESDHGYDPGR